MLMLDTAQAETVVATILLLNTLAGIGWAVLGLKLNISREASLHFCAANLLFAFAYVLTLFRPAALGFVQFFESFNWADVVTLGATVMVHSGLRKLHNLPCGQHYFRSKLIVASTVIVLVLCAERLRLQNAITIGVLSATAWYAFVAFYECSHALRHHFGRTSRWLLLWPLLMAGSLSLLRVLDDTYTIIHGLGDMRDTQMSHTIKIQFLGSFIWLALLTTTLLNASLIGLTLTGLFNKLNEQAKRLQNILDTAPVGVAISAGGKIRFANPSVTEMLNIQVGRNATDVLVWPEDRSKIIQELKAKKTVSNMELQMYCPHNSVRDLLVTYLPTDFDGEQGILGWMIDITERKQADRAIRQANDEQSAIFESATLGIAFVKNGIVARANHRLDELFRCEPGTMLGKSPRLWWQDTAIHDSDPYAEIRRGETHTSTQAFKRADGTQFWCRMSGSAIDTQDLDKGTVWMFDDVSAEHEAVQLMREAKEIAEEATQMKSHFLANMSHEIRTPMNAIIGMSHLALKTELTPKQRNYIEKADAAARNLLVIINDILDFSKIEAGKMQFERTEFYLEDMLQNLADIATIKAQDKGLELLFDIGPEVPTALVGDPMRLGQVMLNLVGNAIKFTEFGEITLGIHVAQPCTPNCADEEAQSANDAPSTEGERADALEQVCLRFDIIDTGLGLTPEQQGKLFNAFSQADASTTRKYGGTGLGLTICKRLVELMNGQIGVESQIGTGSNFYFTAQFGVQKEQRAVVSLDQDVTGLKILVVDDNVRAGEIMLAILSSQKFVANVVQSGAAAIAALKEAQESRQPYGLVLMDWIMPEMDGLATISALRTDPLLHETPAFVMVTAHSRDELLEQADGVKIDGLLQKPVSPSALLDTILCALGKEVITRGRTKQRRTSHHAAEENLRGAYLLLVEDNPVNQELALDLLQQAGIRIDVADNGAQAVAMVEQSNYDGVLMDCQMPIMDGFEATRKIRAMKQFATLPILAMTANAMSGDRDMCLAAGMNDHIGKPIDVDQLFATLNRWVKPAAPIPPLPDLPNIHVFAGGQTGQETHTHAESGHEVGLPRIPGLNLTLAIQRMGGNVKLMRKLLLRFVETQADAMSRIKTAIEAEDFATATREAHSNKGLAGNIGAEQLYDDANALEQALKHAHKQDIPPALAAMDAALQTVLAQISAAMGPAAIPNTAPTPDSAERNELLRQAHQQTLQDTLPQLAELLTNDDTRASKVAESISEAMRHLGQGSAALQLNKLISKYEFEEALAKLGQIAQALNISIPL